MIDANRIECPASLSQFEERVVSFSEHALNELTERYKHNERNFTIELMLDRSSLQGIVPLSVLQLMFYDRVVQQIDGMPFVEAYADFYGTDDKNIMVYRLIVE